jgi:hypothetical protein
MQRAMLERADERKRAIMYTADWRVAEIARRTEGNWNVCAQVMQTLALAP